MRSSSRFFVTFVSVLRSYSRVAFPVAFLPCGRGFVSWCRRRCPRRQGGLDTSGLRGGFFPGLGVLVGGVWDRFDGLDSDLSSGNVVTFVGIGTAMIYCNNVNLFL